MSPTRSFHIVNMECTPKTEVTKHVLNTPPTLCLRHLLADVIVTSATWYIIPLPIAIVSGTVLPGTIVIGLVRVPVREGHTGAIRVVYPAGKKDKFIIRLDLPSQIGRCFRNEITKFLGLDDGNDMKIT